MNCEQAREAASARLDGELPAAEDGALDEHLARCSACRGWAADVAAVSRRVTLRPASLPGPDLTARVLAAAPPRRGGRWPAERWLLVVVGAAMLLAAVPTVLAGDGGHLIREAGVTEIALAVGVLSAAWQPWRAAGVLPVVVVLAAGLTATSAADVLTGAVPAIDEAAHALAPTAALLLWRLRRRAPSAPAAPPGRGLAAVDTNDERKSA